MGDAGIFAWKEKYRHDLWRPMLGIREYDPSPGPGAGEGSELDERGDPFWPLLGSGCGTSALTCWLWSPSASSLSPGRPPRSGERRVGTARVRTCRYRCSQSQ